MNIIEAIQSGKNFRRTPKESTNLHEHKIHEWHTNHPGSCVHGPNSMNGLFSFQDVVADDWEIEEARVEVTRSTLHAALCRVLGEPPCAEDEHEFDNLCRELGLRQ